MTTITDTRTFTDRALEASADRIVALAAASGRPHRRDEDLAVVWQGDRGIFTNCGYVLATPDDWGSVMSRIAEVVPDDNPATLISAATTPDLSAGGWQLVGFPPLMVKLAGGAGPQRPAELTIADLSDEAALEVFERTLVECFPDTSMQPYKWGSFLDGRALGGATRFYTGFVDGEPVATAAGHVSAGVNLVEMVSTAPSARGRGYGAALTWAASTVDPSLPAVLISSDLGRPVYEGLGYHAVSRWTFWHRPAA